MGTLASVLVSVFIYAFAAPQASESAFVRQIGFDVSVDSTVDTKDPTDLLGPVRYVENDRPAELSVVPETAYLAQISHSGPIVGVSEYGYLQAPQYLPKLDVKLANNSNRTLFFTEAVLEVARSTLDPEPILVITNKTTRHLDLHNEGWGDAHHLIARFDIIDPGRPVRFAGRYDHVVRVRRLHTDAALDLTDAIRAEGVNLARVKRIEPFPCNPTRSDLKALRRAVRPFAGQHVVVFGELDYSWLTASGQSMQKRLRFVSRMTLVVPACDVSPALAVSATYQVALEVSKRGYTRTVPIEQYLKPGDVDRFEIVVDVAKSSLHRFRLSLHTNDGHEFRRSRLA